MTTVNTPTGWDDKLNSIMEEYKNLSDEEKHQLFKLLKQDELDREKSIWNIDAILEDLKENYVNIEEYKEMLNKPWDIIHINLPAIWKFNWFKFDCFTSGHYLDGSVWEWKEEYIERSYSKEEILELYEAIIKYMKEYWVDADQSDAWEYLLRITWLYDGYCLLKDVDEDGNLIARSPSNKFHGMTGRRIDHNAVHLFLKPSK